MSIIQPNLASNMPTMTRVDFIARANPAPKREVAEYTTMGSLEDAMLARMAQAAKPKLKPNLAVVPKVDEADETKYSSGRIRPEHVVASLEAAIGEPKTATEIARETNIPRPTVIARLRRMVFEGQIECQGQGRRECGRLKPYVYAKTGTFKGPLNLQDTLHTPKKPELRAQVLAALDEPRAIFQVANLLGIGRANARYQMQRLAEEGLIQPAGKIDIFRAKNIQTWVRV